MTQNNIPDKQMYKSNSSGRNVVPGWMKMNKDKPDGIEIQLDIDAADLKRQQATLLIEYWPTPGDLGLQSLLPVRAFSTAPDSWCVFVPAQGQVLVRAIDTEPSPPLLSAHSIILDPATPPGTVVNVLVKFPTETPAPSSISNLMLNN
ncbi:uracil-DNA glycosylase [Deinococcus psychrotolerans]|uniref:Uracil-DNA glycosylase n=1 Tax=Deinococcus psychrotolerans TaxID=2489213 RepID=A0A3G8YMZ4_9DEIO|nr:uracil-DNA glycosylase [Deinococcus psychrotolerans]AZI42516.1 uracil-DNA glycosylase [Deinococcus psychrotolerans]